MREPHDFGFSFYTVLFHYVNAFANRKINGIFGLWNGKERKSASAKKSKQKEEKRKQSRKLVLNYMHTRRALPLSLSLLLVRNIFCSDYGLQSFYNIYTPIFRENVIIRSKHIYFMKNRKEENGTHTHTSNPKYFKEEAFNEINVKRFPK